ncbi:hypothetical protein SCHPADRAFT_914213 [Schizopora paradoxa]|uniref:Dynamin-type G domain-containing protein n=1 Tax=Schizopora paradoxa TaxID=27342 RepID=A0A0H2RWH5_9AGAM|nr:hypothetical protein SCHPADRAFT_914213 [Schizopora paradoxa]
MAQSYFPVRQLSASPAPLTPTLEKEKQLDAEEVQETFIEQKKKILQSIDDTTSILSNFKDFNKSSWVVRYPRFRDAEAESSGKRDRSARRSMSFVDEPTVETTVTQRRKVGTRSVSLSSVSTINEEDASEESKENGASPNFDFRVLHLDLKLGPNGSSSSATSLVSQLEKSSIANLLDDRFSVAMKHMDKLRVRVEDTSSKVLVTGDLNAGKSTLVNALMRREVMPVDQQPCTTAFCEVHDAAENDGKEEVHLVKEGSIYSIKDESTFTRASIADLEDFVAENENAERIVKLYVRDPRSPSESLLNNGIADISLIDAPGLNRDSLKTTALFARQEEIDVVVFVVSAENHFTLSAREFLASASKEKAYLFIVVNKYEQIKNKEKCRRSVLEQIRELSPRTYEDAADLVHFVDSSSVLGVEPTSSSFTSLEASLRSFVLLKRSKSKLHPAATYLSHLLSDVELLASSNAILAKAELQRAKDDLERSRPILEGMKSNNDILLEGLEHVEEEGTSTVSRRTREILTDALEKIGCGELAVKRPLLSLPPYPGLLRVWDYVHDVRKALLTSLDAAVKSAEDDARGSTSTCVTRIQDLGDRYLPEGVERSRRVFMPEAMFSRIRRTSRRHSSKDAIVAGSTYGLGIGLAHRQDLLETSFLDIFDAQHHFMVYFGDKESKGSSSEEMDFMPSALSLASIGLSGLGALTVVGGKVLTVRSILEGAIRLADLFHNETARKWAAPVLGAFTIGLSVYVILELPNTIPRTVGRRIHSSLTKSESDSEHAEGAFVGENAKRIVRETRKVLRIASWEQRERFRAVMEECTKEVKNAEELQRQSEKAREWFVHTQERTASVRGEMSALGDL